MKTRKPHLAGLLGISALACSIATPFAVSAGEQMQIALSKVNKGDKFELVLDDKNTGRMVFFTSFHSTFKQTKGGNLFDGVNNTGGGYADFTQGHGHITGFDVNEKDGDTYKVGWAGDCYTLNGSDGKPYCALRRRLVRRIGIRDRSLFRTLWRRTLVGSRAAERRL